MDKYLNLTYVGHSTIYIDMDGTQLLTDPLLNRWIWHLRRKDTPIHENVRNKVDAILVSHAHRDHLDLSSLMLFPRETQIAVPVGLGDYLRKKGFSNVSEVGEGERFRVGSLEIDATRAVHDGSRFPFGPGGETLGFKIVGSQTIYFPGDTALFPEMAAIGPGLDIALLPVWGWGPTLGTGHLDPFQAAQALELLRPRLAIPIHWGTLYPVGFNRISPNFLIDPPRLFKEYAAQLAPLVEVRILLPGEMLEVSS